MWQNWRHKFSLAEQWDPVDKNWNVNPNYLPSVGFAYRYLITVDWGGGFEGSLFTNIGVTWTIWIETPACDPYPMVEKPLYSPFAQKVTFYVLVSSGGPGGGMIVMPGNTFYVVDHPTELGFTVEDPPFEYPIIFGNKFGVLSTVDQGGNFFDLTWQSAGYKVRLPKTSKIHISNRRFLGSGFNSRHYSTHTNTKISKARMIVAKDKERRLWTAEIDNAQVEIKRANKDTQKPQSLSTAVPNPYKTQTTPKKDDPSLVIDNRGNASLFFVDTTNNGISFISANDDQVGKSSVSAKFMWPKYTNLVAVGVQSRERPSGVFGIYSSLLCYRRLVGVGCRLSGRVIKLKEDPIIPLGSTTIYVDHPEALTTGDIVINDGDHQDKYAIQSLDYVLNPFNGKYYPTVTLAFPTIRDYIKGVMVLQERLNGGLYSFGNWYYDKVLQLFTWPKFSVHIVGCGFVDAGQSTISNTGTTYIFAQQVRTSFGLITTKGESKSVILDGVPTMVPNIPENSVLVATISNGVLDIYPSGALIVYKAQEEWCGGCVDNTGRVSCLFHTSGGKEVAAYSEGLGLNWQWSRVES